MSLPSRLRRRALRSLLSVPVLLHTALVRASTTAATAPITDFGARADGQTVNTRAIQAAIDHLAARAGGTVLVPAGVFVSGALFFKPGVHLRLDAGAVLQCSTDLRHFPRQRTRIEGHFEDNFTPALINVKACDGFRISGAGTLDGAGRPVWDLFWKMRREAPDPGNFPNLGLPRARLALIESSRGVTVEGITFKDSQFWNLHLYRCREVTVRGARFQVPDDYHQAPSTDGIDLDSCQDVLVEGCYFSVTDDCIAAKGSKGPKALEDTDSPPVERIHVRDCVFKRGAGVLTLGSEATIVRDVLVENCLAAGVGNVAVLKLRPDTPQRYENIVFRHITLNADKGRLISIYPWRQYFALNGAEPPKSWVRNIRLEDFKGRFGSFGRVASNPGQTSFENILLKDFDVRLEQAQLEGSDIDQVHYQNVRVNGEPAGAPPRPAVGKG
ncbi:MAG: glycoside hydrolase family 28 protein [Gammaproteobacteria bacterium]